MEDREFSDVTLAQPRLLQIHEEMLQVYTCRESVHSYKVPESRLSKETPKKLEVYN